MPQKTSLNERRDEAVLGAVKDVLHRMEGTTAFQEISSNWRTLFEQLVRL